MCINKAIMFVKGLQPVTKEKKLEEIIFKKAKEK